MFGSDKSLKAKNASLDEIIKMCEGHIAAPGKKKRMEATIITAKPSLEIDSEEDMLADSDTKEAIEEALNDMDLEDLEALIKEKMEA